MADRIIRDSLGEVTVPDSSAGSRKSITRRPSGSVVATVSLTSPPSRKLIVEQLTRCTAIFPTPRGNEEVLAEIMVTEWVNALTGFSADVIRHGFDEHIRTAVFFPKPSEVLALCRGNLSRPEPLPPYRAGDEPDFAPTAEELARVSAACAKWREMYGSSETIDEPRRAVAPASQDPHASDDLKAAMTSVHQKKAKP